MATLNTDIRYIKGVGEARAKSLAKLGITDLRSLLSYFPRAYDDRRAYKTIADLIPGENACVCAVIAGEPKLSRIRKGLDLVKLRAVDETGALELTYFNQSYLKNTFHTGDAYVFFGRAEGTPSRPQMTNPLFEREGTHQITGRIMPIYPLTAGVSQSMLYKAVEQGLAACVDELPDILPENVRLVYQLCHTRFAYENIHFPTDDEALSAALSAKGDNPHLLVMSATPIPRTLALMIYGDLDVSILNELPPGRQKIDTFAVPSSYHARIYAFLRKLVADGRQAYIVCPMVAENDELPDERKAVTAYAETLQKEVFPDLRIAPIHGKMKPKEKDAVMRAFAAHEIDVLVSTTVIEVGVDVPNAALMLIENAECFGLSQLHQLRGRVGRGLSLIHI